MYLDARASYGSNEGSANYGIFRQHPYYELQEAVLSGAANSETQTSFAKYKSLFEAKKIKPYAVNLYSINLDFLHGLEKIIDKQKLDNLQRKIEELNNKCYTREEFLKNPKYTEFLKELLPIYYKDRADNNLTDLFHGDFFHPLQTFEVYTERGQNHQQFLASLQGQFKANGGKPIFGVYSNGDAKKYNSGSHWQTYMYDGEKIHIINTWQDANAVTLPNGKKITGYAQKDGHSCSLVANINQMCFLNEVNASEITNLNEQWISDVNRKVRAGLDKDGIVIPKSKNKNYEKDYAKRVAGYGMVQNLSNKILVKGLINKAKDANIDTAALAALEEINRKIDIKRTTRDLTPDDMLTLFDLHLKIEANLEIKKAQQTKTHKANNQPLQPNQSAVKTQEKFLGDKTNSKPDATKTKKEPNKKEPNLESRLSLKDINLEEREANSNRLNSLFTQETAPSSEYKSKNNDSEKTTTILDSVKSLFTNLFGSNHKTEVKKESEYRYSVQVFKKEDVNNVVTLNSVCGYNITQNDEGIEVTLDEKIKIEGETEAERKERETQLEESDIYNPKKIKTELEKLVKTGYSLDDILNDFKTNNKKDFDAESIGDLSIGRR